MLHLQRTAGNAAVGRWLAREVVRRRGSERHPPGHHRRAPSGGSAYEVKLYNDAGELATHHVDDRFISNADGTGVILERIQA